jgi:hypothetical protein
VVLAGTCPVFDATMTKDSIADYKYKGYTLNGTGAPIFRYGYRNAELIDQILPADQGKGLTRTIKISGEGVSSLYFRAAQGKNIMLTRNGLYTVDNGRYFVQLPQAAEARIADYMGKQVLLVRPSNGEVNYQIIW